MQWTTEKPTKEGWYWTYDGEFTILALVDNYWGYLSAHVEANTIDLDKFTHWMGPLLEPEPPTND